MTRDELYKLLRECGWETTPIHTLDKIWGRPFDGETEKITKRDEVNTTKSASSTSPTTEDSLATGSEPLPDGTTYTRSYQVFLPTPKPIQTKPIFKTHQ